MASARQWASGADRGTGARWSSAGRLSAQALSPSTDLLRHAVPRRPLNSPEAQLWGICEADPRPWPVVPPVTDLGRGDLVCAGAVDGHSPDGAMSRGYAPNGTSVSCPTSLWPRVR
jgi:hypothetical protein